MYHLYVHVEYNKVYKCVSILYIDRWSSTFIWKWKSRTNVIFQSMQTKYILLFSHQLFALELAHFTCILCCSSHEILQMDNWNVECEIMCGETQIYNPFFLYNCLMLLYKFVYLFVRFAFLWIINETNDSLCVY